MRHSTKPINIDIEAFRKDVEAATPTLVLDEKYGCSPATIARYRAELSGKIARNPRKYKKRAKKEAAVKKPKEPEEEPKYEIAIAVPASALTALLEMAHADEIKAAILKMEPDWKAAIFTAVMQHRADEEAVAAKIDQQTMQHLSGQAEAAVKPS